MREMLHRHRDLLNIILLALVSSSILTGCNAGDEPMDTLPPRKATLSPTVTATVPVPTGTALPPATATPEACLEESGTLLENSYPLPYDSPPAPVKVYLPPCFQEGERGVPVAYFLHGFPRDEDHWIEIGLIEAYEELFQGQLINKMILVFPFQPEPYFTHSDGGPGSLEELFIGNLFDKLEPRYGLSAQPGERAILGISRGGVWALEIGMRHPELFDIVGALSPSLAQNYARSEYDPFVIARTADALPANILITAGDNEPHFSVEIERFIRELDTMGVEHRFMWNEGEHEESAWSGIMRDVLLFVGAAMDRDRTSVLD